jgi:hypothetical protein
MTTATVLAPFVVRRKPEPENEIKRLNQLICACPTCKGTTEKALMCPLCFGYDCELDALKQGSR